jgi:ATP-binding cassette subfamily F protein uup
MMEDLAELKVRNTQGASVKMDFAGTERKTRKLLVAKDVSKSLGGRTLFEHLDLVLSPGTKLGLLGLNGSGKTTFIRVLTGEIPPDTGEIVRADGLRIVVFDQARQQLEKNETLRRALSPDSETVAYRGSSMHITAWAKMFLFRSEQLDMPVRDLSGGEQARILIARLMLQPADVLILDEPTNDLDIPSLEVLEESLEGFPGALVLVTHDRFMLDRLCTELLGIGGAAGGRIYADLSQWEKAMGEGGKETRRQGDKEKEPQPFAASKSDTRKGIRRLTYMEQREWEQIEGKIESAEAELLSAQQRMDDPKVLADRDRLHEVCEQVDAAQREVDRLYTRWEELQAKQEA